MAGQGYTLVELMVGLSITAIMTGVSIPTYVHARQTVRAGQAAEYLASRLHVARLEALKRHANVAIRFETEHGRTGFAMYLDTNANGVRTADIVAGVDVPLRPREYLDDQFAGVTIGVADDVPGIDEGEDTDSAEPVRLGRSQMVSFSPVGTSTSGTVFVTGRGRQQRAVRVLGATGRVRVLTYDIAARVWRTP